ncbi:MAG: hypothetical protein QJR13_09190 [Bacillota bacterium]|nr:hypothetical protein [Bacillota bacterium]
MSKRRYRTQLYLDEAQYLFLKESAAKFQTSIAGVVRQLIEREMSGQNASWESDPLFAGGQIAADTGREDGSLEHDHYIYGTPKRSKREAETPKKGRKGGGQG